MAKRADSLNLRDKVEIPVVELYRSLLGDKVVAEVADKNHAGYPANSVTFITNVVTFKAVDAAEPGAAIAGWQSYGDNIYGRSCLDQWLNSAEAPGQWFKPWAAFDTAPSTGYVTANPYDTWPGLLAMLDKRVVSRMIATDFQQWGDGDTDDTVTTLERKVAVPSQDEMGLSETSAVFPDRKEGTALAIFTDNASRQCIAAAGSGAADTTSPVSYWTRSRYRDGANNNNSTKYIGTSGGAGQNRANNGTYGVRFIFNIPGDTSITTTTNSVGNFEFDYSAPPTIPGAPTGGNAVAGHEWENTWEESREPDGEQITYTVEMKMDDKPFEVVGQTQNQDFGITIPATLRPGDNVGISWTAGENAEGYKVQRNVNGGTWVDIATTTDLNYTDKAPAGNKMFTKVKYRVASMGSGGVITPYTESVEVTVYVIGGAE